MLYMRGWLEATEDLASILDWANAQYLAHGVLKPDCSSITEYLSHLFREMQTNKATNQNDLEFQLENREGKITSSSTKHTYTPLTSHRRSHLKSRERGDGARVLVPASGGSPGRGMERECSAIGE